MSRFGQISFVSKYKSYLIFSSWVGGRAGLNCLKPWFIFYFWPYFQSFKSILIHLLFLAQSLFIFGAENVLRKNLSSIVINKQSQVVYQWRTLYLMMLSFSGEKARLNCSQARLRRRKFAKYVQVIGGCGGCGAQKWQKVSKGNFINGHKKDFKGSLKEVLKMQNSDWRF